MSELGPAPRRTRQPEVLATPGPGPVSARSAERLPSPAGADRGGPLRVLLDRAATSRANVLIEGATEVHRLLIAQAIHARSWPRTGREFICVTADVLPDQVPWGSLLAGQLSVLGRGVRPAASTTPGSVGTVCIEGIDGLSMENQKRLAAEVMSRDGVASLERPPCARLIGGLNGREPGAAAALDAQLEKYAFVLHIRLADERGGADTGLWEALQCGMRLVPRMRVEVW